MTIALFLLATGCRGDFPRLTEGPAGAPPALSAARDRAPSEAARLVAARDAAAAQAVQSNEPILGPSRPARLLAALPAGERPTTGVVNRAARAARDSGRSLGLVAIGAAAMPAAEAIRQRFEAAGLAASVDLLEPARPTPPRVELYLLP